MTAADDKVTPFPSLLERIGQRIDVAWNRLQVSDQDWIEGSLELMQALKEGRGQFSADKAFGRWLTESKHNHVTYQDRAALLGMANDLILSRKILMETTRRSYRHLWKEVRGRFDHVVNPAKPKRGRPSKKPGVKQAQRSVDATPEVWEECKRKALERGFPSAAAYVGYLISEHDAALIKAQQAGHQQLIEELDVAAAKNFTEKGKIKVEDAIRIHKARLYKQFEQQVNEEVRRRIDAANDSTRESNKQLRQENMGLQRIIGERGVFTEKQYRQMLMLCHPDDSASPQLKAELLQVLVNKKINLVRPDTKKDQSK